MPTEIDSDGFDLPSIIAYKDAMTLQKLYHEQGKTLAEIAEIFDVSTSTVRRHMKEHEIERRGRGPTVDHASYRVGTNGLMQWEATDPDGKRRALGVHRLLAIADGADPYKVFNRRTEIHHRNNIPFDNRPENVKVVSFPQHRLTHDDEEWVFDDDLDCPVLVTAEADD